MDSDYRKNDVLCQPPFVLNNTRGFANRVEEGFTRLGGFIRLSREILS
jgi:hypothetical protein